MNGLLRLKWRLRTGRWDVRFRPEVSREEIDHWDWGCVLREHFRRSDDSTATAYVFNDKGVVVVWDDKFEEAPHDA